MQRLFRYIILGSIAVAACSLTAAPLSAQVAATPEVVQPTEPAAAEASSADADGEAVGWLGLRIMPMPEALAVQLGLNGRDGQPGTGLMVLNVVTDGPADRAGLQQYDILVAVNGENVSGQPGRFVQQTGGFEPGEKLRMVVIRQARRQPLVLTVGKTVPTFGRTYDWKYIEAKADGVYNEVTQVRTKMVTRDADGEVSVSELDANTALDQLPDDVKAKVMEVARSVEPSRRASVVRNGQTIEISRDKRGWMIVRRSSRDQTGMEKAVVKKYRGIDEMKRLDPAAWELASKLDQEAIIDSGGARTALTESALTEARPAPQEHIDPSVARALDDAEAYHDQIRRYEEFLAEYTRWLKQRVASGESTEDLPPMWKELLDKANSQQLLPEREFTVDELGHIVVRIRKSSGDLVITFRNEQEMEEMYPRLYEQYRKLLEGE